MGGENHEEGGRTQQDLEERLALIEEVEDARQKATPSYALEFGTGLDKVRNFNPGAVSRFRKLRALSRLMILGADFLFSVVLACAAVVVSLYLEGTIEGTGVLMGILLALAVLMSFLFLLFKFLGELSWLLADLGDHQFDVRNLLLDLRDDFSRIVAVRRSLISQLARLISPGMNW